MHKVIFTERPNAPERLVCEAEIVFGPEAGVLSGMKLVGFSLWRSAEGDIYVSLPSRAFGSGGERRYFDLLRSVEGDPADVKRLKGHILDAWRAQGLDPTSHTTQGQAEA